MKTELYTSDQGSFEFRWDESKWGIRRCPNEVNMVYLFVNDEQVPLTPLEFNRFLEQAKELIDSL